MDDLQASIFKLHDRRNGFAQYTLRFMRASGDIVAIDPPPPILNVQLVNGTPDQAGRASACHTLRLVAKLHGTLFVLDNAE